jgi:hypothetical protein
VDQHGVIIDGHHRQKIAEDLGIPCEQKVREFASEEERHEFALGLNLKRRHLNREQMRNLIASECERTPDASDREIARRLGCSPSTVGAVRRPVSNLDTPPRVTREEAEALTESIRRQLDEADQGLIDVLAAGASPLVVSVTLMRQWAKFEREVNDAEATGPIWRHVIAPRIQAILNPTGLTPPTASGGEWQIQIPATIEGAVAQLNALAEWRDRGDG